MGFNEEIIKDKRKVTPLILFSQALNTGSWDGPATRLYSSKFDATGAYGALALVESFGTFSRSLANSLYTLEIPTITTRFLDPDDGLEWHRYANEPYDTILRKWVHYLLRVHDDNDEIFDATVALGQIIDLRYPPNRRASITSSVAAPETMGDRLPLRTVLASDWPDAPAESLGRHVPIIYGRHTNVVNIPVPPATPSVCCPVWTPAPYAIDPPSNPNRPGVRWSDDFSQMQGPQGPDINGANHPSHGGVNYVDGWILNNYHSYMDVTLEAGAGPGGSNALVALEDYGEITRGVGVQITGLPFWHDTYGIPLSTWGEHWDTWPPRFGRNAGQYGAAAMLHYWDPNVRPSFPDLIRVWAASPGGPLNGQLFALTQWNATSYETLDPMTADSVFLQVKGQVHRKNGAYDSAREMEGVPLTSTPDSGTDFVFYTTQACKHVLIPQQWQLIELKWKCSSFASGDTSGFWSNFWNPTTFPLAVTPVAADGWIMVRIDGQVVIHLQEIELVYSALWPVTGQYSSPNGKDAWRYWESVTWQPSGRATCLMVSDRLWCDEAEPITLDDADPCADNSAVETGQGALPTIPLGESSPGEFDYLLCSHAIDGDSVEAYAPLPGIREKIGGLNLMTGEKEPITYEETEPRMTLLQKGVDYDVFYPERATGRYTILRVYRNMRSLNTCEYAPVTVNCTGIMDRADGLGTLIEDGPQIVKHFLLNWVFNKYVTGDWFTDVANAPGIVDSASFDQASADILAAVGFTYIGAVALINPTEVRTLIQEALTTFGLHMFYKNIQSQTSGSWSVVWHNMRNSQAAWSSAPLFSQQPDMVEGTFETVLSTELLKNALKYKAGPSYTSSGWAISGAVEDLTSIGLYRRLEGEIVFPWTNDPATALDRAEVELAVRRYPIVVGTFQTKGRGVSLHPGTIIRVGHDDAPGLGWDDRSCLVVGNDLGLDAGAVGIRFISPVSFTI